MRTLAELVEAQPEVIVLCNPLKAMPAILGELRPLLEPYQDIALTDVGSVKMMVRDQVRDAGLAGPLCRRAPDGRQRALDGPPLPRRSTTTRCGP